ncbi:gamma-glutamylcyclotransferase family protein [Paenibacillus protaetiae]|uniref:Gamma-glutamylcyclotransferase n=1 Tax=Paenibacillus protaetiae TaxID=2509456 RepID=A0A4P6EUM3_9BACL|nr:gamma-glutamylcyclotransferase family protein [Paenibacillus protaetiae]QAY66644.1 gamma-glutamylcyclotransferase [Paenibacillus protaetiae]
MNEARVFLYGTLLPGQSNHHIVKPHVIEAEIGAIEGRLVDFGGYPAVVRDGTTTLVKGQWIKVGRAGLAAMDKLEEFYGYEESNDYLRVWVRDAVRKHIGGWVYIWESDRGCPTIRTGYWPDHYKRKMEKAD